MEEKMENALEISELTKSFNGIKVLDQVSMTIKKGSIYGFLGPNGAGKTTVMKSILNLVKPDSGQITVFGKEIDRESYTYLAGIGSIVEAPIFYNTLNVRENLELHCEYVGNYDKKSIERTLAIVGLKNVGKKKVKELSQGMKQRLGIARALISDPELLILDEPINGLDPFGIRETRELLLKINNELGTTVFISSHIIAEIDTICDCIGFIKDGRIIQEIERKQLKEETKKFIEIEVSDVKKAVQIFDEKCRLTNFKVVSSSLVRIYDDHIDKKKVSKALMGNGIEIYEIKQQSRTLEEYFIGLMSQGRKEE